MRYVDLSVVHDTIAILRTETLWREPDSIGNIYPLMTAVTESAASRQTQANVVATRIDTLFITSNTDDVAMSSTKSTVEPSYQARGAPAIAWGKILIITVAFIILTIAVVIVVRLLRRFSFP